MVAVPTAAIPVLFIFSIMSDMTFKMAVATNVGLVRSNNEDNFIVNPDLSQKDAWFPPVNGGEVLSLGEFGCLLVVADGMGGMNAGEVASAIAIDTIKEEFSAADLKNIKGTLGRIEKFMSSVVEKADDNIKKKGKEDSSTSGMGTTVVMAWIVDAVAHISWCGDSRAYLFNPASGLIRLSKDHSYVQQLVDEGKLDEELAFDHPESNIITRSLGDSYKKAEADFVTRHLTEGDRILLCSDGLCGLCRDEEILKVMMSNAENIEICRNELIAAALDAGGYDNVTVALFETVSVPKEEGDITLTSNEMVESAKRKKKGRIILIAVLAVIVAVVVWLYVSGKFPDVIVLLKNIWTELSSNINK